MIELATTGRTTISPTYEQMYQGQYLSPVEIEMREPVWGRRPIFVTGGPHFGVFDLDSMPHPSLSVVQLAKPLLPATLKSELDDPVIDTVTLHRRTLKLRVGGCQVWRGNFYVSDTVRLPS